MPPAILSVVVIGPTVVVVAAICLVLWRERTSDRDARVALTSGVVLTIWTVVAIVLAYRGYFRPDDPASFPPIGINLVVVLLGLAACLVSSRSLRGLLTRQHSKAEGGVEDLGGNVCEWTSSHHPAGDNREDPTGDDIVPTMCGGAFLLSESAARASARLRARSQSHLTIVGFRVAISSGLSKA